MTCSACETARATAKDAGHRDWADGVCFEHAAFDLDSPEGRALMAEIDEPQIDLFGDDQ